MDNVALLTSVAHPATLINPDSLTTFRQDVQGSLARRQARSALATRLKLQAPGAWEAQASVATPHDEACLAEAALRCYGSALLFLATGKPAHAERSLAVLEAWCAKCRAVEGPNAPYVAAWSTATFSRAYELLRHCYLASAAQSFAPWVRATMLPHLRGETERHGLQWGYFSHWHAAILEARLQFALVTDDVREANWCVVQHQRVLGGYIADSGFTGESLRSSDCCSAGLASLVHVAELLAHQGVAGSYSERLFRALELHAGLLAAGRVPMGYRMEQFAIKKWVLPSAWEVALRHYEVRTGIAMPNVRMLVAQHRPFGYHLHSGFDTLTHGT